MENFLFVAVRKITNSMNEMIYQNNGTFSFKTGVGKVVSPSGAIMIQVNLALFGSKIIVRTFNRLMGEKNKFVYQLPKEFSKSHITDAYIEELLTAYNKEVEPFLNR